MIQKWAAFLRRRPAGSHTHDGSPAGPHVSREEYDGVIRDLRAHVVSVSGGALTLEDVLDDVNMYDAGYVDSVGVTEFMIRVTGQFDVLLPDWKIGTELKSLRDVACHILAEMHGRPAEQEGSNR